VVRREAKNALQRIKLTKGKLPDKQRFLIEVKAADFGKHFQIFINSDGAIYTNESTQKLPADRPGKSGYYSEQEVLEKYCLAKIQYKRVKSSVLLAINTYISLLNRNSSILRNAHQSNPTDHATICYVYDANASKFKKIQLVSKYKDGSEEGIKSMDAMILRVWIKNALKEVD
jgi:hypothetical protein